MISYSLLKPRVSQSNAIRNTVLLCALCAPPSTLRQNASAIQTPAFKRSAVRHCLTEYRPHQRKNLAHKRRISNIFQNGAEIHTHPSYRLYPSDILPDITDHQKIISNQKRVQSRNEARSPCRKPSAPQTKTIILFYLINKIIVLASFLSAATPSWSPLCKAPTLQI